MFSKQFTTKMIDKLWPRLTAKNNYYSSLQQLLAKKFAVTAIALAVAKSLPVCLRPVVRLRSVCPLSWPFVKTISRWHMELQLASWAGAGAGAGVAAAVAFVTAHCTWGACQTETLQQIQNGGKLNMAAGCSSFKFAARLINICKIFK